MEEIKERLKKRLEDGNIEGIPEALIISTYNDILDRFYLETRLDEVPKGTQRLLERVTFLTIINNYISIGNPITDAIDQTLSGEIQAITVGDTRTEYAERKTDRRTNIISALSAEIRSLWRILIISNRKLTW